jgi:hypothetical protein
MHVNHGSVIQLMLVGAGSIVNLAADGGSPLPVYTTTEPVEIATIVGPCEVTVTGTNTFYTSAGL